MISGLIRMIRVGALTVDKEDKEEAWGREGRTQLRHVIGPFSGVGGVVAAIDRAQQPSHRAALLKVERGRLLLFLLSGLPLEVFVVVFGPTVVLVVVFVVVFLPCDIIINIVIINIKINIISAAASP